MPTIEEIFSKALALSKDEKLLITCETPKKARSKRTMLYRLKTVHQDKSILISIKENILTLYKDKHDDCLVMSLLPGEYESITNPSELEPKEVHLARLKQDFLSSLQEINANTSLSPEERNSLILEAKLPIDQAISYYNKLERATLLSKGTKLTTKKDKLIDDPISIYPREEINYDDLIREETRRLKEQGEYP